MAGHPLRSATDRRLGGPLPHQLPNQTRVHLIPPEFFTLLHAKLCAYAVLAVISNCYPPVWGRLPTRYSPVRRSVSLSSIRKLPLCCFARLACVRHAASVHPEPGSNSHVKSWFLVKTISLANSLTRFTLGFVLNSSQFKAKSFALFLRIFRVCVWFNLQFSRFASLFPLLFVSFVSQEQLVHSITVFWVCQQLFSFIFFFLFGCFLVISSVLYDITLSLFCQAVFSFFQKSFLINFENIEKK